MNAHLATEVTERDEVMPEFTNEDVRRAERVLYGNHHRTSGLTRRTVALRALEAGMELPEEPKWVVGSRNGGSLCNLYWSEDREHARFTAWNMGGYDTALAQRLVDHLNKTGFTTTS